jgi:ATP adenylyltransferase
VPDCFVCQALAHEDTATHRENLVVDVDDIGCVMLNRFPYNNGHLLILPRRHVPTLAALTDAETFHLQRLIVRYTEILTTLMKPDGFNIGLNLGSAAGAGLPGHLHWHLVPRWNGDANFMPVIADTKVIVQSLDALWVLLRNAIGWVDSSSVNLS